MFWIYTWLYLTLYSPTHIKFSLTADIPRPNTAWAETFNTQTQHISSVSDFDLVRKVSTDTLCDWTIIHIWTGVDVRTRRTSSVYVWTWQSRKYSPAGRIKCLLQPQIRFDFYLSKATYLIDITTKRVRFTLNVFYLTVTSGCDGEKLTAVRVSVSVWNQLTILTRDQSFVNVPALFEVTKVRYFWTGSLLICHCICGKTAKTWCLSNHNIGFVRKPNPSINTELRQDTNLKNESNKLQHTET